jgi:hypothetical protein
VKKKLILENQEYTLDPSDTGITDSHPTCRMDIYVQILLSCIDRDPVVSQFHIAGVLPIFEENSI